MLFSFRRTYWLVVINIVIIIIITVVIIVFEKKENMKLIPFMRSILFSYPQMVHFLNNIDNTSMFIKIFNVYDD